MRPGKSLGRRTGSPLSTRSRVSRRRVAPLLVLGVLLGLGVLPCHWAPGGRGGAGHGRGAGHARGAGRSVAGGADRPQRVGPDPEHGGGRRRGARCGSSPPTAGPSPTPWRWRGARRLRRDGRDRQRRQARLESPSPRRGSTTCSAPSAWGSTACWARTGGWRWWTPCQECATPRAGRRPRKRCCWPSSAPRRRPRAASSPPSEPAPVHGGPRRSAGAERRIAPASDGAS